MPTYILQKDTPLSKSGDELILKESFEGRFYVISRTGENFHNKLVENNPEWFLPKTITSEKIHVELYEEFFGSKKWYICEKGTFCKYVLNVFNATIPHNKFSVIKEYIERVLNNEGYEKKYSIQDMEKCWLASRIRLNTKGLGDVAFTFKGFIDKNYVEDYK